MRASSAMALARSSFARARHAPVGLALVVTGLLLVGLNRAAEEPVDNTKIAVKLVVALAVAACAEIAAGRDRRGQANPNLVHAAGALAVVNTMVAVLWT